MSNALSVLRDLAMQGRVPLPDKGVCENLDFLCAGLSANTHLHYLTWVGYSGDPRFPVSGQAGYYRNRRLGALWTGGQFNARISLIDHCIRESQPTIVIINRCIT